MRLDLWALLLAMGIVAVTVAPLLATILFLVSLVVAVAAAMRGRLVPRRVEGDGGSLPVVRGGRGRDSPPAYNGF